VSESDFRPLSNSPPRTSVMPVTSPAEWKYPARRTGTLGRLLYLGVLLAATLTPFERSADGRPIAAKLSQALRPTIEASDAVDGARNLVLFAGWGLVWTITSRASVPAAIVGATLSGGAISLGVESLQLFSANRRTSVLDVATNTSGALAGAIMLGLGLSSLRRLRLRRSFLGVPAVAFAAGYTVACTLEGIVPLLRQDLVPDAWGWPSTRFAAAVAAFDPQSITDIPATDVLLFLPAGFLCVIALVELGWSARGTAVLVTLFMPPLFVAAELAHGALGLPMSSGRVLWHALAPAVGAWAAAIFLPPFVAPIRSAARVRGLVTAYLFVLALWAWRPYAFELPTMRETAAVAELWWIPLRALGMRLDMFSVVDVCIPFLLYLPLGTLLAVWPVRMTGALRGAWPAVWVAIALEAGQMFVGQRMVDVTDMLVPSAGALSGHALARRAGYEIRGMLARGR